MKIKLVSILILMLQIMYLSGQVVTNFNRVHTSPKSANGLIYRAYTEGGGNSYMLITTSNNKVYVGEDLIMDNTVIDGFARYLVLLKLDEFNKYVDHTVISGSNHSAHQTHSLFVGADMKYDDGSIYIGGFGVSTDTMYIDGMYHREWLDYQSYVWKFNEELELEDEFYFGGGDNERAKIQAMDVKDGTVYMSGLFWGVEDNWDYSVKIGNDSLEQKGELYKAYAFFYVEMEMEGKVIRQKEVFGGQNFNTNLVYNILVDSEERVYIQCDANNLRFRIKGEYLEVDRGNLYDAVGMCIAGDTLNYLIHYEGKKGEGDMVSATSVDGVYESLYSSSEVLYMNTDSIVDSSYCGRNFIFKRSKKGDLIWSSKFETCNSGNRITDMEEDENGELWVAGYYNGASGTFSYNEEIIDTLYGIGTGFMARISGETGVLLNLWVFKKVEEYNRSIVHNLIVQGDGKVSMVMEAAGPLGSEIDLFGEKRALLDGIVQLWIYDVDCTIDGVEIEEISKREGIQPNVLKEGSKIWMMEKGEDVNIRIYDISGKEVWHGNNGSNVFIGKTGMYIARYREGGIMRSEKLFVLK